MSQTMLMPAAEEVQYVEYHAGGKPGRRPILRGEKAFKTFDEIPVVDLSKMTSPVLAERKEVAKSIYKVCTEVGFFYATNHTVSLDVIDETFVAVKAFFALPTEVKMEAYMRKHPEFRGYEPFFDLRLDPTTRGDFKEAFVMASDATDSAQNLPFPAKSGPPANNWPTQDGDALRRALTKYYNHVNAFSRQLLRLFALALDLDEDYFEAMTSFPMASIRALHYPPQQSPDVYDIGIGAHTDYSWFTVLLQQDGVQSLEVLNKNGIWVPAPPIRGSFVINIGDFLQLLTNHKFLSTVHRVFNNSGKERYSIPFFLSPNAEANIDVLPSCRKPGETYETINAGEYHAMRLQSARKPVN
ncbi:Oxoglutarate/iron-dependent oxygenase [Niveomyces insectorum RCEF 264]|uniref:Oxoglutarate/iron-dependent oxygenase n=1 Tax=Niveomyces insectorum RCEF 264 TaxID=1081102 RepID=A0A167S321_9HYPO|nr:Oxoglutarate/iron-dependent oxygenase [Niveomyces insectorum RCEF 264]